MQVGLSVPHTSIECKTPDEVWSSKPADYSILRVFWCPAYAHVNEGKWKPRAKKCIFLGYASGVKGCGVLKPVSFLLAEIPLRTLENVTGLILRIYMLCNWIFLLGEMYSESGYICSGLAPFPVVLAVVQDFTNPCILFLNNPVYYLIIRIVNLSPANH